MENLYALAAGNTAYKQFRISDLLFTEYKCLAESAQFDIWSMQNYFVYVMTGKLKWVTPNGEYLLHTGEMAFVKKGGTIIHKYFDEGFCCLLIFMPDDYIREVAEQQSQSFSKIGDRVSDSVIPINLDGTLHAYFQSLASYFFKAEAPVPALLEIKFRELLLNIISSREHPGIAAYFKSLFYSAKPYLPTIMEANYTYNLSLEEFAKLCGRSLTVFKNDFKEIYNCSPGRWLTQRRLEHAQKLLENTDKTVGQLILECGFENASHFTRVFKEKFGKTPVKYRT